jgi:hypothetical protein
LCFRKKLFPLSSLNFLQGELHSCRGNRLMSS